MQVTKNPAQLVQVKNIINGVYLLVGKKKKIVAHLATSHSSVLLSGFSLCGSHQDSQGFQTNIILQERVSSSFLIILVKVPRSDACSSRCHVVIDRVCCLNILETRGQTELHSNYWAKGQKEWFAKTRCSCYQKKRDGVLGKQVNKTNKNGSLLNEFILLKQSVTNRHHSMSLTLGICRKIYSTYLEYLCFCPMFHEIWHNAYSSQGLHLTFWRNLRLQNFVSLSFTSASHSDDLWRFDVLHSPLSLQNTFSISQ